ALVEDFILAADTFFANDRVDRDEQKAFKYYQRAAANNHRQALYKLALAKLNAREKRYPIEDVIRLLNQAADQGSADAAYFLATAYLFNDRFNGNPSLVKQAMLKFPDDDEDDSGKLIGMLFHCLYPSASETLQSCAESFATIPTQSRKSHDPLVRQMIARLITSQQLTESEIATILNSYHAITTSNIDAELVEAGRLVTQANGKDAYQAEGQKLNIGDRIGVKFTASAGDFFVHADEQLGAVVQWLGVGTDGSTRVLKNMLFYGSPK
ncbi:MAG: hypothetical protein VYD53_16300, partial [Pseudomonadota bacterium]|nr:hypothetical protein [Pseudomonadota bacterium]